VVEVGVVAPASSGRGSSEVLTTTEPIPTGSGAVFAGRAGAGLAGCAGCAECAGGAGGASWTGGAGTGAGAGAG